MIFQSFSVEEIALQNINSTQTLNIYIYIHFAFDQINLLKLN